MPEYKLTDASRHVSSMYVLVKLFGAFHVAIIVLQLSLQTQNWKLAALSAAGASFMAFYKEVKFLWSQAEWFRVSLIAQLVIQAIGGTVAAVTGTTRPAEIAAGIGLGIILVYWSAINNFCKEYGIPPHRVPDDAQ